MVLFVGNITLYLVGMLEVIARKFQARETVLSPCLLGVGIFFQAFFLKVRTGNYPMRKRYETPLMAEYVKLTLG